MGDNISVLNKNYIAEKNENRYLEKLKESIEKSLRNRSIDDDKRLKEIYLCLKESNINNSRYANIASLIDYCDTFYIFMENVEKYKNALLKYAEDSSQKNWKNVLIISESLKENKSKIDRLQVEYKRTKIDSEDKICQAFHMEISDRYEETNGILSDMQQKAKELMKEKDRVELRKDDTFVLTDVLPEKILIAEQPIKGETEEILKDIGLNSNYKAIYGTLKEQGNIIVKTSFEDMTDERIDRFVIAFIIRLIEKYPLGAVNFHIFDDNTYHLYKRMENLFKNENGDEISKKIIKIHTSLEDLKALRSIICDDIYKKISYDKPDLYAIYDEDKTDPFNIIILRDGFLDNSGYAAGDVLDTIRDLTGHGNMGDKCGLRFLIIDNSSSFVEKQQDFVRNTINQINSNCETKMSFSKGTFSINDIPVNVLSIVDNMELYLESRISMFQKELKTINKNLISIDEMDSELGRFDEKGNILFIPVGKSGGKQVELPFSCRDEDGTAEGACIGYIAIGQSGSGKSSFFHSIVLNGCRKYSPDELQFWLLDFKNGGASSKYRNSGLPHIKIIAENNKIDDALCLFQMIKEEMSRRIAAFNALNTNDITEYNPKAVERGLEVFPRIIIAIDEVQEIFRDDNASVIQTQITEISSRMRSTGMHFVMVAQNLKEGKTYMLKEAFMPSARGRVCFRVGQDIPSESGFEEEFIERKEEISELKVGEAYISYGKDTVKKVKVAFASAEEMVSKYFGEIRQKYQKYSQLKPRIIGSKQRLSVFSKIQGTESPYLNTITDITISDNTIYAVVGEDSYRMIPLQIEFSQVNNSSTLLLGSDSILSSSFCTSIALCLSKQNVKTYLFNADTAPVQGGAGKVWHPYLYLCKLIYENPNNMSFYRADLFKDVLAEIYGIFLDRQKEVQKAVFDLPEFSPIFIIINDLSGIESFVNRESVTIGGIETNATKEDDPFKDINIFDSFNNGFQNNSKTEDIQKILNNIVSNGYRYNIHLIASIKGDPSIWYGLNISPEMRNVFLFNNTDYAARLDNSYFVKEMLNNISNEGDGETMAVLYSNGHNSKLRPFIYDLSLSNEKDVIERILKGEC